MIDDSKPYLPQLLGHVGWAPTFEDAQGKPDCGLFQAVHWVQPIVRVDGRPQSIVAGRSRSSDRWGQERFRFPTYGVLGGDAVTAEALRLVRANAYNDNTSTLGVHPELVRMSEAPIDERTRTWRPAILVDVHRDQPWHMVAPADADAYAEQAVWWSLGWIAVHTGRGWCMFHMGTVGSILGYDSELAFARKGCDLVERTGTVHPATASVATVTEALLRTATGYKP